MVKRLSHTGSRVAHAPNGAEALLRQAEGRQEQIAAALRLVIFAALLGAVLGIKADGSHYHPLLAATLAYGALAVVGIFLAWRRLFHPVLPYVFVTFEITLLAAQALLMAQMTGMSASMVFMTPVSGAVFVLLAHASMRYRPWLVLYAGGLYLGVLTVGGVLASAAGSVPPPTGHGLGLDTLVHH